MFGYHQLAAGRTPELAEARSQAEAGVVDYTAACRGMGVAIMAGGPLRQLFWRPARLLADPGKVVAGGRGVRPHPVDSGPLGSAGSRQEGRR